MWAGSSGANHFVDVVPVAAEHGSGYIAQKPTLAIFMADDLPVGQAWLEEGEQASVPTDVIERVKRRRSAQSSTTDARRSTSLVICTRDRPQELERCLSSLSRQSVPPDEIVVVDNASRTAETRNVTLAAGATYIREERPGLDFARNTGILSSRGEIVLYADDDTELHPRWIEFTLAAFDEELVAAVTGLVLPATLKSEAQWLFEKQWSFGRGFDRIDYASEFYQETRRWGCPAWIIGAGANMAFRRSIFEQIGLFDERLDVGQAGCSGDSEFWYRTLAAGFTCRYEPTAVVWHHHRLTLGGLANQIYHYMRGHTAALMVQFERTGDRGNLRRAFIAMPRFYLRQFVKRVVRGRAPDNRFLWQQVSGAVAGLIFYARTPKPAPAQAG